MNSYGLFADDATFYASATSLTDVQLQLQEDLSNTATWTKEHGMVAHPEKIKYMIMGTRQKLSRCEECALSLWLDDRNKFKRNVSWAWSLTSLFLGHLT